MERTNVRTKKITIRLSEDEYKYLKELKNRTACSTISETIRHLIHRFKELEEIGYTVVSKRVFDVLYGELYNIAVKELKKELNRLLKDSSSKPSSSSSKLSNSI